MSDYTIDSMVTITGAEYERMRAEIERLTNAEECLRDDLTVARDENERLRAALDVVRASGLLIGSTTLHDRVRSAVYNAIDALAQEKKEPKRTLAQMRGVFEGYEKPDPFGRNEP